MRSIGPVVRMVAQRSLGHWRLFCALSFGAVLCAALMACVVLYSDAVRDLGLEHAIESQPRFQNDVQLTSSGQKARTADYEAWNAKSNQLLDQYTSWLARGRVHYGRSATFFPTAPGDPVSADEKRPRLHFQFIDNLADHVTLVDGKAPATAPPADQSKAPVIEVWIGKETAERNSIRLGQEFDVFPHWRKVEPIRLVVVGFIAPRDIEEEYWFGKTDRFDVIQTSWATYPVFVDEATLARAIGGYLPDMDISHEVYVFVATGRINNENAEAVKNSLGGLKGAVSSQLIISSAATGLDTTISDFEEKLFFTRLPLFALMIQIVGIVLFYLVMVSTMVIERQAGEIALLKSRGAGTRQVLSVFFIEGAAITLLATILGPFVAAAAISFLGLTPPFEDLSHGDLLTVPISPVAFALALAGGLLAMAPLLWPAYRACGYSITHYKQQISRPPRQPAFLRYYLDLVLIAGAGFAFYQLRQKGSFVTEDLFGGLSADPILLATPTLFMLMVALVFLRLFPLLLQAVLWLTKALKGPTIALGLTRMARSPLQHSRLILLLLLATAVGMFAAGFRSTLERGYEDRAAYRAGAESRIADIRNPANQPVEAFRSAVMAATGTTGAVAAARANAYYTPETFRSVNIQVLGVEPQQFQDVTYWRDDFADESLSTLLGRLRREPGPLPPAPIVIPDDARFIGVWAQNPLPGQAGPMGVRLRDKDGAIWEYRLVTESPNQPSDAWRFFAADLSRPSSIRPSSGTPNAAERKWTFDAFFVQLPGIPPAVPQPISVPLDDLQVSAAAQLPTNYGRDGFADGAVIEAFEAIDRYELVKGVSLTTDPGSLARGPAPAGRSGNIARLSFTRGRTGAGVVAFRTIQEARPVPVIVDTGFLKENKLKVGSEFPISLNSQYSTVKIVGAFKLFPTFDPERPDSFFVADLETLRAAAMRMPGAGTNFYANEAWFPVVGNVRFEKVFLSERGFQAEQYFVRTEILAEQSSDPLVAASWEGILFLAFAGVLIVSTLGFVIYASLGAQARSLEFAILRTMGLSARQILAVVTFEQAFVVVAGVAAGTLLGFPLSRLMISYMGLTEAGNEPLPPLVSVVNWQSIATVYALLGIIVVSTVISLVALYSRLAVSRALRMGEL